MRYIILTLTLLFSLSGNSQTAYDYYVKAGNNVLNNELDAAMDNYNKSLNISPANTQEYLDRQHYYNGRGVLKTKLGDYQGAIEDFDIAIDIETTSTPNKKPSLSNYLVFLNRSIAKYKSGDTEGACYDLKMADLLGLYEEIYQGNRKAPENYKQCGLGKK